MSLLDHQNQKLIEDYYASISAGNFDRVIRLHAPDVVCWMLGNSIVSGRFSGRDALYAHMTEYVLKKLRANGESYVKAWRVAIVDSPYVVGLMHGGLPLRDGGRYDQHYLQIFRIEGGLIREIVEFYDLVMVETTLMGNSLKIPRSSPFLPFAIESISPELSGGGSDQASLFDDFCTNLRDYNLEGLSALVKPDLDVCMIGNTPLSGLTVGLETFLHIIVGGVTGVRKICASFNMACVVACSAERKYAQNYALLIISKAKLIEQIVVFLDTVEPERQKFKNPIQPISSKRIMPAFDLSKVT